jgi:hypothetical protein
MADEPTLPTLPDMPPPLPTGGRKRGRAAADHSSTSSDPAFFSSDDDPALDNYESHARRKKRYVGAWFDQQPASSDSAIGDETPVHYPPPRRNRNTGQAQKREFKRQMDSGVWMDTDCYLTETDDGLELQPSASRLPKPVLPPTASPMAPLPPRTAISHSLLHYDVQEVIRECVDRGVEEVDLR